MATISFRSLVVMFAAVAAVAAVPADEPRANADTKLVGTWKAVYAKYDGQEVKRSDEYTQLLTAAQRS
jgi:hypothetical protein